MNNGVLAALYGFELGAIFETEFSLKSLENIIFDIISFIVFTQEQQYDQHIIEVDDRLNNQRSGRLSWYRFMALKFQYGFDLIEDTDVFDNSQATEEQIEASKIIKYAAVAERADESGIIIKIAGETDGQLSPLTQPQYDAIVAYFREIRWPGKITIINYEPDLLYLDLIIERDPLVLDANGMSILNGDYPVNEAIDAFLKELPFNGQLAIVNFVDKLQQVPGVIIPHVNGMQTAWIDPAQGGYGDPVPIYIKTIPVSGYYKIAETGFGVNLEGIEYVV